jgi:GDP-D-mannose dehydratase
MKNYWLLFRAWFKESDTLKQENAHLQEDLQVTRDTVKTLEIVRQELQDELALTRILSEAAQAEVERLRATMKVPTRPSRTKKEQAHD